MMEGRLPVYLSLSSLQRKTCWIATVRYIQLFEDVHVHEMVKKD